MHGNKTTHHVHENAKCKSEKSEGEQKKIKTADQRLRGNRMQAGNSHAHRLRLWGIKDRQKLFSVHFV